MSCSYLTPLRIVAFSLMVLGFVLHAVGLSAKQWDGIDMELYGHHYYAYQNLWGVYDKNLASPVLAFYSRIETWIPEWKINIIILETTSLGLAVLSAVIFLLAFSVNKMAKINKIRSTMSILALTGCLVAACESIIGVKLYQNQYKLIISNNAKLLMDYVMKNGNKEIYGMTWAPYMCIGAGVTYAVIAVILIIDCIWAVAKKKSSVSAQQSKD